MFTASAKTEHATISLSGLTAIFPGGPRLAGTVSETLSYTIDESITKTWTLRQTI